MLRCVMKNYRRLHKRRNLNFFWPTYLSCFDSFGLWCYCLHLYLFQDSSWTFHVRCLINYEGSSWQHYKGKKMSKPAFDFTGSYHKKQKTAQTRRASPSRQLSVLRGVTRTSALISNDFLPPFDYYINGSKISLETSQYKYWSDIKISHLNSLNVWDHEKGFSKRCLGVKRRNEKSFSTVKELHCVSIITNCK